MAEIMTENRVKALNNRIGKLFQLEVVGLKQQMKHASRTASAIRFFIISGFVEAEMISRLVIVCIALWQELRGKKSRGD